MHDGGTGETVNNLVINDDNLHGLGLWWICFAEATDTERAILRGRVGDGKTVWSHSTMISDLQSQQDKIVTLDELGRWQAAIVAKLDSQELEAKLQGLAADGFMSTLDCSATKLSPAMDLMRLSYAACGYLGAQMGKEQAIELKLDDTGDKDMGKVLRPAPISATDVGNTLKSSSAHAPLALFVFQPNQPRVTCQNTLRVRKTPINDCTIQRRLFPKPSSMGGVGRTPFAALPFNSI